MEEGGEWCARGGGLSGMLGEAYMKTEPARPSNNHPRGLLSRRGCFWFGVSPIDAVAPTGDSVELEEVAVGEVGAARCDDGALAGAAGGRGLGVARQGE